jgi:release factor glutamine methyltransferase
MQVRQWQLKSERELKQAGVDSAHLDCRLLLEFILGISREQLLASPEIEITEVQLTKLDKLFSQRLKHIPMAYIRGTSEFYGRNFVIKPSVLVPRPESEAIIELLDELIVGKIKPQNPLKMKDDWSIADIGTGSGALAITAKLEHPNSLVDAYDIDAAALNVAKTNVDLFTLDIRTTVSNLIDNFQQDYDVFLCNLPYVPDTHPINSAAEWEPKIALFGGRDGLDLYRELFQQIKKHNRYPLYILFESFPSQITEISHIAAGVDYELLKTRDFGSLFGRSILPKLGEQSIIVHYTHE